MRGGAQAGKSRGINQRGAGNVSAHVTLTSVCSASPPLLGGHASGFCPALEALES